MSRLAVVVALLASLAFAGFVGRASATPAVAYQLNAAHTGVTPDPVATAPTKRWADALGGTVSYPLIVGPHVFVTAADSSTYGTRLYALDKRTGAIDWGPIELGGTYYWSGITYDRGRVYALNFSGVMRAFDAQTGTQDWMTQLPGQHAFTSPPTAHAGLVYAGGAGSGGTLYAMREATGSAVWTAAVANGDDSSPAVSSTGVYVSYACGQSYDFAPRTGAQIWHRATSCEGGGGKTPVLANGRLYVRDFSYPAVLNSATGAVISPFATSGPAPAVDATNVYDLTGSTLTATQIASGTSAWSFQGDGTLSSAPLVAGGTVLIGSNLGDLYGLSATTGTLQWTTNVGAPITSPDEQNAQQLTGLATSRGWLLVPASTALIAYR